MNSYELKIIEEIDALIFMCEKHKELSRIINIDWGNRIRNVVENWGEDEMFSDGGYNLFRIFDDEDIIPCELNSRMVLISDLTEKQQCPTTYRKTRSELNSKQNNQILSSIFELIVLSSVIESLGTDNVALYPKIDSRKDVEAKIKIDNRWIYIEAKAIGYYQNDMSNKGSDWASIPSSKNQVENAIKFNLQ